MRIVILSCCMVLAALFSNAEGWNPFVNQGIVSPDPLLPLEFKGTGKITFNVGNKGNSPLSLVVNQEMTMIITLSYGIPDHADPLAAVGGTWADKFNWSYNASFKTFTAIQNQEIPASSVGSITIQYKVTTNSQHDNPANGFNVNLQPPPYSNGVNPTEDDAVSSYTYVLARDFGDAPASYGSVMHEINIYQDPESGAYENYMYLGLSVDPESADQHSAAADGDDNQLSDDEDGVTFPALMQGNTATIPVVITVHDYGTGTLNAWSDWNGDGDFTDPGEKIVGPLTVYESGTLNLSVTVPLDAIDTVPTFARFRLGDNKVNSGTAESSCGEVEDYQISILSGHSMAISNVLTSKEDIDLSGSVTLNDLLTYTITVTNTGTKPLTNVVVGNSKIRPDSARCATLAPGATCVLIGTYTVTQADLDAGAILNTATGDSDETEAINDTELL